MNAILKSGLILGGLLLLGMPTAARAVDVSDAGHFFSAEALEKANQAIAEIEKKSGHEIRIETHATVPADKVEAVSKMDRTARQEFMHTWVKERAKAVKENGTLILICKDPARIETWFSGKLKDEGFTQADRDKISDVLTTGFKAKNFDVALSDAVATLGTSYAKLSPVVATKKRALNDAPTHGGPAANRRNAVQRPMQSSWMPMIWTVGLVLLGMFVISSLIRAFSGGGGGRGYGGGGYGGQPGYGGGYGGGGGGFLSSLAGGIFGAVAGNWVYDQFSGGHSAHAHDSMSSNSDPLAGSSTLGDDNSSNDDWTDEGSSSGGGWFDGGDSGGGGGDFGGGGDVGGGDF